MGQFQSAIFPHAADQQQQQQPQDDVPWFLRYGARGTGAVGGLITMVLGVMTCITISPICIVAGIFQMMAGLILVVFEAPCCCPFLDHVQQISKFGDSKPYWQKAAFYLVLSLPSIVLCQSISALFGCALIFLTAVLYGMMALGKKASREEMITRAQSDQQMNQEMKVNLMSEQTRAAEPGDLHQI